MHGGGSDGAGLFGEYILSLNEACIKEFVILISCGAVNQSVTCTSLRIVSCASRS